jgi:hypothetical protein
MPRTVIGGFPSPTQGELQCGVGVTIALGGNSYPQVFPASVVISMRAEFFALSPRSEFGSDAAVHRRS